jgi:cytochrome c oxidase subunit 4
MATTTTPRHVGGAHADDHDGGPASTARYWIVWVLLLAGTVLTLVTSRIHLPGVLHIGVALLIACIKSALVVMFFMHLWDHPGANRLVFGTSVFFVVLLIGLTVLDNAARFPLANPGRGATLQLEPPGPDLLTPRGPPAPAERTDVPPPQQPGHSVPTGAPAR